MGEAVRPGSSSWELLFGAPGGSRRSRAARVSRLLSDQHHEGPFTGSMLGFSFTVVSDDPGLTRALASTLADLAAPTDLNAHEIHVLLRGRRRPTLWVNGVRAAPPLARGLVLGTLSWIVTQGALAHSGELLLLHAGAVSSAGRSVLIVGPSGAGKSTLTAALTRDGFSYLSDEIAAVEPKTAALVACPKPLSLGSQPAAAVPDLASALDPRVAEWTRADWQLPSAALGATPNATAPAPRLIVFPQLVTGMPTSVVRLDRRETFRALVTNAFNVPSAPQRNLTVCAALSELATAYSLQVESIDAARVIVAELLDDAAARNAGAAVSAAP